MTSPKSKTFDINSLPVKKYLTIGEVSRCTGIKDHVLRYWEQHFDQLTPSKRSGRRYYQRDDVLLIVEINRLLNEEGLTITGAQNRLSKQSKSKGKATIDTIVTEEDDTTQQAQLPLDEAVSSEAKQEALKITEVLLQQLNAFQKHIKEHY